MFSRRTDYGKVYNYTLMELLGDELTYYSLLPYLKHQYNTSHLLVEIFRDHHVKTVRVFLNNRLVMNKVFHVSTCVSNSRLFSMLQQLDNDQAQKDRIAADLDPSVWNDINHIWDYADYNYTCMGCGFAKDDGTTLPCMECGTTGNQL